MLPHTSPFRRFVAWMCTALVLGPLLAHSAPLKPVRLAIGPFFAPPANDDLRQAAQLIPELLTADLSHTTRYQLVEREKIQNVWSEMHLGASGLVARDTITRLGSVLACDWVISGSLVQAGGKTHVWTKVIDVRDGVVVDLNVTRQRSGSSMAAANGSRASRSDSPSGCGCSALAAWNNCFASPMRPAQPSRRN